jgi:1D-myo-inositol 3-kinase
VKPGLQARYTTVGHVTVDVLADGSRRAGGAAFYSALQAARLGLDARILTRGVPEEIERLLDPFRGELHWRIEPAAHTTTLHTTGSGSARSQRVLAWAGPISEDLELECSLLHLAPVARETPTRWRGHSAFVGLTPQGLVRRWSGPEHAIAVAAPAAAAEAAAERCDAVVLSAHERDCCSALIARARAAGATVAVTNGAEPNTLLLPGAASLSLPVPALPAAGDDLGAGDVFAAAFFVALSEGRAPVDAAGFANAAAAVRMSGEGAAAIGDRDAIEARLTAVTG